MARPLRKTSSSRSKSKARVIQNLPTSSAAIEFSFPRSVSALPKLHLTDKPFPTTLNRIRRRFDLIWRSRTTAGSTPSEGNNVEEPERDFWSKLQIILSPVGGLLTALAVAFLGIWGSAHLNRKQESDTQARVYAELTSQREQAESVLRKDMFGSIFDPF